MSHFRRTCCTLALTTFCLIPATSADDATVEFKIESPSVTSLAINKNSSLLAVGGSDGGITICAPNQTKRNIQVSWSRACVISLAFAESLILSGNDNGIVGVFDVDSGEMKRSFDSGCGSFVSLSVSPNERLVSTVGLDNNVRTWLISSGRLIGTYEKTRVSCAQFLDNEILLVGTRDGKALMLDVDLNVPICEFDVGPLVVTSFAIEKDHSGFAATSGYGDGFGANVSIWNRQVGGERIEWTRSRQYNNCIKPHFLPATTNGSFLASRPSDGSVFFFERTRAARRIVIDSHNTSSGAIAFDVSADGRHIVFAKGQQVRYCAVENLLKVR